MRDRHHRGFLGGVCAEVARRLNFSTFGVRVVVVVMALIWPFLTIGAYLLGALALRHTAPEAEPDPFLRDWDRRMADYDRRAGR